MPTRVAARFAGTRAAAPVAPGAAPADPVDELIKSIRIPPRPSLLADLQAELAEPSRP